MASSLDHREHLGLERGEAEDPEAAALLDRRLAARTIDIIPFLRLVCSLGLGLAAAAE